MGSNVLFEPPNRYVSISVSIRNAVVWGYRLPPAATSSASQLPVRHEGALWFYSELFLLASGYCNFPMVRLLTCGSPVVGSHKSVGNLREGSRT